MNTGRESPPSCRRKLARSLSPYYVHDARRADGSAQYCAEPIKAGTGLLEMAKALLGRLVGRVPPIGVCDLKHCLRYEGRDCPLPGGCRMITKELEGG